MVRIAKVRRGTCLPFYAVTDTPHRPYLHMYKHSNEVEEVAVINLSGVNLESNREMEALLGVCTDLPTYNLLFLLTVPPAETLHLYAFYIIKLLRHGRAQSEGARLMDFQVRPDAVRLLNPSHHPVPIFLSLFANTHTYDTHIPVSTIISMASHSCLSFVVGIV